MESQIGATARRTISSPKDADHPTGLERTIPTAPDGVMRDVVMAWVEQDGSTLNLIRRRPSQRIKMNGDPVPDDVCREVYAVVDGRITLVADVAGIHEPARLVPERIMVPLGNLVEPEPNACLPSESPIGPTT